MKTKNFPTRKNQRRVEALERMQIDLKNTEKNIYENKFVAELLTEIELWVGKQKKAIQHLEAIIAKPFSTRTKKNRSVGGREYSIQ